MNMPGISGAEALVQIRSVPVARPLPVILLTGEAGNPIPEELQRLPELTYLQKPVDLDRLNQAVRRHLEAARP